MKALITLLATAAPATSFAASTAHVDNSGLFVWIFLGFCAMIVAAQVIPAALMFFGRSPAKWKPAQNPRSLSDLGSRSENSAGRGQVLTILQVNSCSIDPKNGETWSVQTDLQ